MTITYPLTIPTSFGASDFKSDLIRAVAVSESPFSFSQQVQEHPGEAWEISFVLNLLNRDQAEAYNAFLLSLAGRVGTFTMAIPGSETPRGVATGTPLVKGAGQTGRSLIIDGFTTSTVGILKAGDWIQLGSGSTTRLYKVLADVDSNGSGEVTVDVAPKIITAPADNDPVVVTSAKGLFRLKNNSNPINIKPPNQMSVQFSAREVR
jgi:hypothetical protein